MNEAIWGEHRIDPETPSRFEIGGLSLELALEDGELWWSSSYAGETRRGMNEPEWMRWVSGADLEAVTLAPCLPDRPVIVEPEIAIDIAPRARAVVYVSVPLWVRVLAGSPQHVIAELPARRPADTWWGDPTQGELAYAHLTKARRRLWEGRPPRTDAAHCRMELLNHSGTALPVAKVAVRAAQLGVYRGARGLWTNEVRVTFTDDSEGSQIEILKTPPGEAGQVDLATPPRVPISGRWRALTFSRLVRGGGML